ncbi:AraC family transcriptional regulator [Prevotella sp. AM34-19LB]|uniref:helix-turn-helix domain-containing protein n=1 Tax=Prevotella sp. AM34-19LB TaxID=2292364 RepID=UPI000E5C9060|nr:helix-turn-helix domain-containing protein [Prevotella sp. AM34-19LB]RHC77473.1 AraC family transcriptional regulator [Prevotella sp. AM34-19LB]
MELSELSSQQEASLSCSGLEEWQEGPQVLTYGAILICRKGKAMLNVNYKDWELYEGAVITLFPNDVVELKVDGDCKSPQTENGDCKSPETENGDCKSPQTANSFQAEILKYNPSLLREASLQLEQTVYSSLREDRCRQDTPVVTNIINGMFGLLKVYFDQSECTCISQLVLCQLKAFFIGFHEYLQRNPQYRPDEVKLYRVRELFNRFMMLLEKDYKISRDVNYYAEQMNISSKYLTNIVNQVTGHTPKTIIDQYVILQLKMHLKRTTQSIKEMAWEFHFADVSFFCRYFKKHTDLTPQQIRS